MISGVPLSADAMPEPLQRKAVITVWISAPFLNGGTPSAELADFVPVPLRITIDIFYPSSFYYHFVVDASERMRELHPEGRSLFASATDVLIERVEAAPGEIYVGLRSFGPELVTGASMICENTILVLPFEQRSSGSYKVAIEGIKPEGTASLLSGIYNGIGDLIDLPLTHEFVVPNPPPGIDPFYLTIVTAGGDECQEANIQDALRNLYDHYSDTIRIDVVILIILPDGRQPPQDVIRTAETLREIGLRVIVRPVTTSNQLRDYLGLLFEIALQDPLASYEASLELGFDLEEVLLWRAAYLGQNGEFTAALADIERLQALTPSFIQAAQASYLEGLTLANQNRWSDSLEAFEAAVELKDDFAAAQFGWAVALANLGRTSEAINKLEMAFQLNGPELVFRSGFHQLGPDYFESLSSQPADLNSILLGNAAFYYLLP